MRLCENITATNSRLDREHGIVRGVKILGFYSENGHEYTAEAMRKAVELYEGIRVNVDHPARRNLNADRSYRDRFGRLKNVRFDSARGLIGDLHYNKGHELAEQFEYDVLHDPKNVGLSHNASGRTAQRDGKTLVVEIFHVRSVDLVADPATNVSLFESRKSRRRPSVMDTREFVDHLLESDGPRDSGYEINDDEDDDFDALCDEDADDFDCEDCDLEINDDCD